MKKFFPLSAVVIATAAVLVSAPSASAVTQHPLVTDLKTAVTFGFAAGESAESITVNPDGSATVSLIGSVPPGSSNVQPKLERISPSGHRTVLVTGQPGEAILGNTRGRDGTIYYNVMSTDPSRFGVWALPSGGTPHRIGALPPDGFPNGLTIDSSGHTLYAADSEKSTIWAIPASGGTAIAWLTDPALAPLPSSSFPLGANGVRFHNSAVWVSNTDQGTLSRVPVTYSGKAGRIELVSSSVTGIDDFNFLSARADVVFAALNGQNEVAVVHRDGTTNTVLTEADGLDSPTSTAVCGDRLFVTNAGFAAPNETKLLQAKINLSSLFGKAVF
ncbi:MAG TPA: hypothetical protein VJT49_34765 [Amycolatopsis sp.]|uniref:hypothetical protein n=1 Tax=Amycolatopsis sp. TaxID=37632 RepID=UPI002B48856C|nr:hypothetical protein [Amycolatopsis sp.]HKS50184.1 hypothetical protein [Amycolatopsis sp.]